jgi:hypothetical protein
VFLFSSPSSSPSSSPFPSSDRNYASRCHSRCPPLESPRRGYLRRHIICGTQVAFVRLARKGVSSLSTAESEQAWHRPGGHHQRGQSFGSLRHLSLSTTSMGAAVQETNLAFPLKQLVSRGPNAWLIVTPTSFGIVAPRKYNSGKLLILSIRVRPSARSTSSWVVVVSNLHYYYQKETRPFSRQIICSHLICVRHPQSFMQRKEKAPSCSSRCLFPGTPLRQPNWSTSNRSFDASNGTFWVSVEFQTTIIRKSGSAGSR